MSELFSLTQQQRWWWHRNHTQPHNGCLWLQGVFKGEFQTDKATSALHDLVEKHEILRTGFPRKQGMKTALQMIHSNARIALITHASMSAFKQYLREPDSEHFDWIGSDKAPRLELHFFVETPHQTHLGWVLPGIQVDKVSLLNLAKEWFAAYHKQPCEQDEPLQYADFEAWQVDTLEEADEEAKAAFSFWNAEKGKKLTTAFRSSAPKTDSNRDLKQAQVLSPIDLGRLDSLCREHLLDREDLLASCLLACLDRFGWQQRPELSWVHPGRKYEDMPEALGPYAIPLGFSFEPSEQASLVSLAKQIQAKRVEMESYQEYFQPHLGTKSTGSPQFESVVLPGTTALGSTQWQTLQLGTTGQASNLSCSVFLSQDHLTVTWSFAERSFWQDDDAQFTSYWQSLLGQALQYPEKAFKKLGISDPSLRDIQQLSFNAQQGQLPTWKPIHQQFEVQAAERPKAIALVFEEQIYTYEQLNHWANHIARVILNRCEPGLSTPLIGLSLERKPVFIAAMLGVLKAGLGFVPIDPQLPQDRQKQLREQAAVQAVLCANSDSDDSAIVLSAECPKLETPFSNPTTNITANSCAYVLFTSGSTGVPKGVLISQQNVSAYTAAISERLQFQEGTHFAHAATLFADLGYTCLFPPLCLGKTLHLLSEQARIHPGSFAKAVQKHGVDYLKITPSHLQALLTGKEPAQTLPKKKLIMGGEAPHPGLLEKLRQLAPEMAIVNHYGPTETTIGAIAGEIENDTVPLGRPLASAEVYLTDAMGYAVPQGVIGEICIAGESVALGYLDQPRQTAEAFRPNGFATAATSGSRLYHTGDLGRFQENRQLVFSGRRDEQVKIRGFRIELAEISHTLKRHADIEDAVLILHGEESPQLVAYVCTQSSLETSTLETYLESKLPAYMLPHHYVLCERFPLNANGKIDRKALPKPQHLHLGGYVAPRNDVERILCDVVQRVLKLDQVGILDNFFRLGGDSIQCILVVAMCETHGLHFTVEEMFRHQSIGKLADHLANRTEVTGTSAHPAETKDFGFEQDLLATIRAKIPQFQDVYPLAPVQKGLLFHALYEKDSRAYLEQKMVRFSGQLDEQAFLGAWQSMVERYPSLGVGFDWETMGQPVQFSQTTPALPFQVHNWQHLNPEQVESELAAFLEKDRAMGFDLSKPPLMRLHLFQTSETQWQFLWTHHHLILDGWSLPLILKDWKQAYQDHLDQAQPTFPPAPAYRNFIHWLGQQDTDQVQTLWRQNLAEFTQPTYLANHQTDSSLADTYQYEHATIAAEQVSLLESWLSKQAITMNTALQLAWGLTLCQTLATQDVVYGTTVSGRPPTLERVTEMVGLFINTMPVRTRLHPEESVLSWANVHQSGQVALREFCHLPLVDITKWSDLEAGQALFDHLLIFENVPHAEASLKNQQIGELTMELLDFRALEKTNYTLIFKILPGQSLNMEIMFDAQRIAAPKVKQLLKRVAFFLTALPKHQSQTVKQLLEASIAVEQRKPQAPKRFQARKVSAT